MTNYLCAPDGSPLTNVTFDMAAHLAQYDEIMGPGWEDNPAARREVCRYDPLMFAWLYLRRHITWPVDDPNGTVTFSDMHLQLYRDALEWHLPLRNEKEFRDAYAAPRESGKSTTLFLILVLWAAAYKIYKYIVIFSGSADLIDEHMGNLRMELDTNRLLRLDFPELTTPATRGRNGRALKDSAHDFKSTSGVTIKARSISSQQQGMKAENLRPQLLIVDDIQPLKDYTPYQARKMLFNLINETFQLNKRARVVLTGTVKIYKDIMHQLVLHTRGASEPWITEQNFRVKHFLPFIKNPDGTRRSFWEEAKPLWELEQQEGTRDFALNMLNMPLSSSEGYWKPAHIDSARKHGPLELGDYKWCRMSVDVAGTSKASSDFTGLAIVKYRPAVSKEVNGRRHIVLPELFAITEALEVKLSPPALREYILNLLQKYPYVGKVMIEVNFGSDFVTTVLTDTQWHRTLHDLPVPISLPNKADPYYKRGSKEANYHLLLNEYDQGQVIHEKPLPVLEDYLLQYPEITNDDVLDAVAAPIVRFRLHQADQKKAQYKPGKIVSYVD